MTHPTHHDTDWRQQSAMATNHAPSRGWAFDPEPAEPTSLRPWFLAGVAVLLLVGFCFIASVSA